MVYSVVFLGTKVKIFPMSEAVRQILHVWHETNLTIVDSLEIWWSLKLSAAC